MNNQLPVHEDFLRHDDIKVGSERGFGFVFAGFCALVAGYMLWENRLAYWPWIIAAAIFAVLATSLPRVLRPLNVAWFKLGLLLHQIVNPVVLGLMFFTVFTPIGLWMRLTKKRPLSLQFDPHADTYWIPREPPGPASDSFRNQF